LQDSNTWENNFKHKDMAQVATRDVTWQPLLTWPWHAATSDGALSSIVRGSGCFVVSAGSLVEEMGAAREVPPRRYCPPHHPTHSNPRFLT
jgi:hypothetical protein